MRPDAKYFEKREEQENITLDKAVQSLSDLDKEGLRAKNALLAQSQKAGTQQDLSCLPTLKVSDISRKVPDPEIVITRSSGGASETMFTETRTNGIVYVRTLTRIHSSKLTQEQAMLLPLFANVCWLSIMADCLCSAPHNDSPCFRD